MFSRMSCLVSPSARVSPPATAKAYAPRQPAARQHNIVPYVYTGVALMFALWVVTMLYVNG